MKMSKKEILDLALEVLETSPVGDCDFDPEEVVVGFRMEYKEHIEDENFSIANLLYLGGPNVTKRAAMMIALSHLMEIPDYYTRLVRMELEAKRDS